MKRITRVLRPASCVLWAGFACLLLLGLTVPPGVWAVPGDIAGNGTNEPDGFVGISDLNRVLGHWGQTCDPGDWTKGDITGDGFVGIEDQNVILGHWNQSNPDPFLGTNLGPLEYWKSHWAFVDVIKMAREWQTTGGAAYSTDADGWPTAVNPSNETVFTMVFIDLDGAYPGGDYVLTYEGTADVTLTGDVTLVVEPNPGDPRRKIVTVIPGSGGIRIDIDNINTGDPIKNIRLWMPTFENAQSPFHPLFISRLRAFKVLRFMDWQKINGSNEVDWDDDRKQPTHAFQNDNNGGVALEYIVQLCNELEADPWFCMPHKADDNYVTQFAQQVKNNLHVNATIYVEWSNELWNGRFGQGHWVNANDGSEADGDDTNDNFFSTLWFRKWALESANDFQLWTSEFTGDPRNIVRVVAGQKDNVWVTKNVLNKPEMLDPADPTGNEVLFDAIACSTYLSGNTDGFDPAAPTPEEAADSILDYTIHRTIPLFDTTDPNDPDPDPNPKNNTQFYMDHEGWADTYSTQTGRTISFISYEGGQHFVRIYGTDGNEHIPTAVLLALQRRPLMYKAYVENIKAFKDAGGSLFMAFNSVGKFTEPDMFGHFESQNESINDAPKHRAVIGGGGR